MKGELAAAPHHFNRGYPTKETQTRLLNNGCHACNINGGRLSYARRVAEVGVARAPGPPNDGGMRARAARAAAAASAPGFLALLAPPAKPVERKASRVGVACAAAMCTGAGAGASATMPPPPPPPAVPRASTLPPAAWRLPAAAYGAMAE